MLKSIHGGVVTDETYEGLLALTRRMRSALEIFDDACDDFSADMVSRTFMKSSTKSGIGWVRDFMMDLFLDDTFEIYTEESIIDFILWRARIDFRPPTRSIDEQIRKLNDIGVFEPKLIAKQHKEEDHV